MGSKKEIKVTNFSNGKGAKIDIYSPDSRSKPHDTVHVKVNYENKSYSATTKVDGKKETSSGSCYLTSACMQHFNAEFNDHCYELQVLRWFRDNFVSEEDIIHYYETAPVIVEAINNSSNFQEAYSDIYQNVVQFCVHAIELKQYDEAYERYKNSILSLEEKYARPELGMRLVRCLKTRIS